jgi:4-amino-4-deoxy-L-arabinose transferase-like glycosyltransferase
MKVRTKELVFLGIISSLAALIYTYKLSSIPNGFYVDEAVVAYNAYSILETGKDIFAQPYPILFRLLGSYTPPLFIYISALFIKYFGVGISVFRSISVISVLISVVFFYLIIRKLNIFKSEKTYLLTTLFYAISPWLVFNARLGYETTLAYALFNIGVYFFLLALGKPNNLIWGVVFMSLSTYTAHTQRFLVPVFCVFYLIFFLKDIIKRKNLKILAITILITLIIHIPHFTVIATPAFWVKNERLLNPGSSRIIQNIFIQVFSFLSTKNLFYKLSDIDAQHTIPGISVIYNWMVIPLLIGLFWLFYRAKERNIKFLLILSIASLIPAVMSGEFISIQRALPFLLPLMMVVGLGIDQIVGKLHVGLTIFSFVSLFLYSILMLYRSYFILFPIERAEGWNYGYNMVADYIRQHPNENFVVDNSRDPGNYILLLYYLRYPPQKYQMEVDARYKNNYYRLLPPEDSYKFSNVEVRVIDWRNDSFKDQIIIGDPLSVSESQEKDHYLQKVHEINNPLGNTIFNFYKTNPFEKCKLNPDYFVCVD